MTKVGIVGWRGMVGSVLLQRMNEEKDWGKFSPSFFSTSLFGKDISVPGLAGTHKIQNAHDLQALAAMEVIVTCQGGDYTNEIFTPLRQQGWDGYWIDAASSLRMRDDAIIVLDPVNGMAMRRAMADGIKNYIGGNCTVSLMLMALQGLLQADEVEWISTMTYQAASGAGAGPMRELIAQMAALQKAGEELSTDKDSVLALEKKLRDCARSEKFPVEELGYPLAGSLIPWIDKEVEGGYSREEWKGSAETNKILGWEQRPLVVDGICVRVGVMRCHSQALTICLKKPLALDEIENILSRANPWVHVVPNRKEDSSRFLTPAIISGTLNIAIGRLRKMKMGPRYLSAFTCGDQLLWGAAEPVRRTLSMVLDHLTTQAKTPAQKYEEIG